MMWKLFRSFIVLGCVWMGLMGCADPWQVDACRNLESQHDEVDVRACPEVSCPAAEEAVACDWLSRLIFSPKTDDSGKSSAGEGMPVKTDAEMHQMMTAKHGNIQKKPNSKADSNGRNRETVVALNSEVPMAAGCIDINLADEKELSRLPGVGLSRAQAIVNAREKRPFKRKKDIMRIKGIGAKSYRRMVDQICDISG